MKLSEYIKSLQEIERLDARYGDLEVIYSRDEEGNGFEPVTYGPSIGIFTTNGNFSPGEFEWNLDLKVANAICIN